MPSKQATTALASAAALALLLKLALIAKKRSPYIDNPKRITQSGDYDFIIVGGGTAGCALAARLSENQSIRVLLLEAGGSSSALPDSVTPAGFGRLLYNETHVHGLRTEPQTSAKGQMRFWPRAKMLGGCSAINAQMAQYGAFGDFDEWATYTGDDSYTWAKFGRYFRKFEGFLPHPDYPKVDASYHGTSGPVKVGYNNTITANSKAFVEACIRLGIPRNPDFNGPDNTNGAGRIMTYVDGTYKRVSAESAYLTSDVLARRNLTVATNATVLKVLFDKTGDQPRASGVEFARHRGGQTFTVTARKEIILCGGAVHTPHILMHSGIGPASHLQANNIPVIVDLPGVGQNLVDHPVMDLYFKDKFDTSAKFLKPASLADAWKLIKEIVKYKTGQAGSALAMNFGECAAFVRSDDPVLFPPEEYPEVLVDSSSAPDSPDLELFSTPFAYKEHGKIVFDVHTFALHCYLLRPTSKGAVLLKSSDPWVQPSVNPNYISTREDLQKLVRGVKLLLRIARTAPLSNLLDGTFTRPDLDHEAHLKTDVEIEDLVRTRVETVYHPASTCRMGPVSEAGLQDEKVRKGEVVVDAKLNVVGTRGLRVCDASVFPWIVSGHTAGACYALAEKLADELKAES